jgi:hypothetical protein
MALGTLPFVYYLWPATKRVFKPILLLQVGLVLNIIIFTGSRTGYVGLLMMIAFVFLQSKYKKKFLAVFALLCIVSIPFVSQQYYTRFETIFTLQDTVGGSIEKRIQILHDAWQIFLKHPFGVGIEAFEHVRFYYFGREQATHNLYLQVATHLGIQGFIIFFLLIYKLMNLLIRLKKSFSRQVAGLEEKLSHSDLDEESKSEMEAHRADLKLMMFTSQAVFLFIFLRLVLGMFGMDLYEIYWWFAIGLTISLFNMDRIAESKTDYFVSLENSGPD